MVRMGSVDGCPLTIGFGRMLMTGAVAVDVDVTLPASVDTDDVEPPIVVSSVLLLNTLSTRTARLPLGSAGVIGFSSPLRAAPTPVVCRMLFAETPSDATTPEPVAVGFPPATAAVVSEQASPRVRKAFT